MSIRVEQLLGDAVGAQLVDHAGAALPAGHEARRSGTPASSRAAQRRAPRRCPCAATTSARSPAAGSGSAGRPRATIVEPELRRRARALAPRSACRPTTSTRGAGSTGSRKISIAPPDRHGFWTVTAPSSTGASSPVLVVLAAAVGKDPQQHRLRRSRAPSASTRARSARAQTPPTKPSIVPSASTSATSPGFDARRPLRPHNGRGHERRALPRRAPALAATSSAPIIAAARDAPASPPRRAPGVQGMSMWSTPCVSCSASITALTIAGGEPTFGDSPTPLAPSGWCGHGRDGLAELEVGALERGRDQVVHERPVEAVALLVERDQLHQRDADALGEPAVDLAVDDHRVDPHAAVVDRDEAPHRDLRRCRGRCRRPRCRRRRDR